jgi:hypothetical protein
VIILPFPPAKLSGHDKRTDYARAKLVKEWRQLAWAVTMQAKIPKPKKGSAYTKEGDIPVRIVFIPPSKRGDRMNFLNRLKPAIDGIADALEVNDARFVPSIEFRDPEAPGRVEISIGE